MEGLVRCSANYVPLSPISFLERAGSVHRDRTSIIYGSLKYTWKETRERCLKLASALAQLGVSRGDVVAVLAPNIPPMYELHFGVPMAGAVLCTLNVRHNSEMLSFIIRHSETKVIFVDYQLLEVARGALDLLRTTITNPPLLILIGPPYDPKPSLADGIRLDYECLVATGSTEFEIRWPNDEWDPIAINYTSGTTSSPKGVVSTHRGAYLNGIASVFVNEIKPMPVYLWTVPMFHANGWALVWGVATQGGTNVCLRNVSAEGIFNSIALHKITNMGAVPTVLNMILNAPPSVRKPLPFIVDVMTGGAPPPYQAILKMEELGFRVAHSYGLTETSGPALVCTWNPEWDSLPPHERAKMKSRQGMHHAGMEKVDVVDPVTMKSVPEDAKSIGEVMVRGNPVMHGYFKNLKETEEAFRGGWFRTGDLAVKHPNGYIQLKDRSKDIIISGGENVSSIEVESVLYSHPAVVEAAVVARPDDHWGETPCAFVKLKEDQNANAENIIMFCRERLPHYMAPRTVLFEDLPKTATGKILKSSLRQKAKAMGSLTKRNTSKI